MASFPTSMPPAQWYSRWWLSYSAGFPWDYFLTLSPKPDNGAFPRTTARSSLYSRHLLLYSKSQIFSTFERNMRSQALSWIRSSKLYGDDRRQRSAHYCISHWHLSNHHVNWI